ncbi:universal stress protein [Urechidicola croceus]|uniref:Universal stress protein UspA n=1 Tax=Urechidicola croceus TaxID=1850246 RepID=A0A1D8PA82_9FLAO|nr:universal stress protein [Urechidicola croceus]AOW21482.1 universal stress protein UspA [Urechidicola croceus]
MKKILVPIDFSKQAEFAAQVAAKIAEQTNSELHLLHMLELPTDIIDPSNFGNQSNSPSTLLYMKRAQEKFEKLTKRYFLRNVKIVKSVFFHDTFDGIIKESKKQNVDLIVMGSQGVSGFDEILVGSNTEKVVRHSDVPVMVIKNEIENFELKNLVFASDFKEVYKPTLKKIIDFAKIFNAKIHLLRVITPSSFDNSYSVKEKIKQFVNGSGLEDYTVNLYNDRTIEDGVLHFGKEIDADLIAINTHGKRGLIHLFNNSISGGITNHAIRPVITFKVS